ncbi:MAG: hypothetical protein H0X37_22870 [Herpetosiphonaceae bacterium]|nr:hypothetical protein [Herpetosiphonaceae bacterium]
MAFLRKLFGGGQQASNDAGLYLFVKCNNCGAPVRVRVNPSSELAADYGDTEAEGYTLTKEIMDDRCFRVMRAQLAFDKNRRETGRTIEGGTFITAEEYDALKAPQP